MKGRTEPSPLVHLDRPDSAAPLLATGLAAAVVLRGDGTVRCPRETRGGGIDWGGVYCQGVRLTGPWEIRLRAGGAPIDLPGSLKSLDAWRWAVRSRHLAPPGLEIEQWLIPFPEAPGVGRRLRLRNIASVPLPVEVDSEIAPFLSPVLIEGLKPYEYEAVSGTNGILCASHGHRLGLASSPVPGRWTKDEAPWTGDPYVGELRSLGTHHELVLPPGGSAQLDSVVWGGVIRAIVGAPALGAHALAAADAWEPAGRRAWSSWLAETPRLSFPSDPILEKGYELARSALRALYTRPDPEITGLVAGYPWYCSVWGRDLGWMLPAVLWMGDGDWVQESLRTIFRFQATHLIPLLAAEAGELPMQVSPGPVFLFGTSDTTLYYPEVLRRFVAHTGRSELVGELWGHLCEIVRWADAKIDADTGLFTHGGEVLALRNASEEFGSIHYGIDAPDTTIWDSADRRDHAIDLQVLLHIARRALVGLATDADRLAQLPGTDLDPVRLATSIRARYAWPEESYLVDSLRRDGSPRRNLRPNALRAVSAGLLDPATARQVVERAARPDLSTAWGVRTLSSSDPTYDPQAYHEGQVWTIATAWAADAALAVGDAERGIGWLRTIASRIVRENGLANECYRGDRDEPFDSCFLLGFSVAPFLSVLFERLWGLTVDASGPGVRVEPCFPSGWTNATLEGLRIGAGRVGLRWSPDSLTVTWEGPRPLGVALRGATGTVESGATRSFPLRP